MSLNAFLRLLRQQLLWFVLIPAVTAGTVFYVTRNEPTVYKSEATLYTGLASGYSLLSDKQTAFTDRSADAFENLLTTLSSRETLLQVGESLLAEHLRLQEPDSLVLGPAGFAGLRKVITPEWRLALPIDGDSVRLQRALDSLAKTPADNPVKSLLFRSDSPYSVAVLTEKLKASARKGTNDVLLMDYESDDPAVTQRTLHHAIAVLNNRYSLLKTAETNSVVGYYEARLQTAKQTLDRAEANLRAFSVGHKILDFDEEARNVAAAREALTSEYNGELGRRNAAKAAMDALNRRITQQSSVNADNTDLSQKQQKLTEAESQLANARAYGQPKYVVSRLQTRVNQAQDELTASAQQYNADVNSTDAVPSQAVAIDRLAKQVEFEESSARLALYGKRLAQYQAKTNAYSPLGSQLRQLNRDLSVAEKDYLDLLEQVGQSRTRRQDVAVAGRLEVLDRPNFPLVPQASERPQLIVVGLVAGLLIALLLTVLRFLLDKRLYSPEEAEREIGQPVTALFPNVKNLTLYSKAGLTAQGMFEQLGNALNIELAQVTAKPYPPLMTLFSIRPRQGKTWVADGLSQLYAQADQQVAYCYPRVTGREGREVKRGITYIPYTVRPDFMNVTGLEYLLDVDFDFKSTAYDRIVLELPALINHPIPVYLLNNSALSLLVVDTSQRWGRTERQLLSLYQRVASQPLLTVLNRVEGDYFDKVVRLEIDAPPTGLMRLRRPQANEIR